ncbi:hypothetical protein GC163_09985 [bacterium]|nr:hypothetical protein [bacterium]
MFSARTLVSMCCAWYCTQLCSAPVAQAGIILVTQNAGVVTITGTGDDDRVSVRGNPGRVTLSALGQSTFPSSRRFGGGRMVLSDVTGIVFNGMGGDDSLSVQIDLETLEFYGGPGNDSLTGNIGPAMMVIADMGPDDDGIFLSPDGASVVSLSLGDGNDSVTLNNCALGMLEITDGGGNETVLLSGVDSLPEVGIVLSILLDEGDDQLVFQGCNLISADEMMPAMLDGGEGGNDQVGQIDSVFTPMPMIEEFEVIVGFDPPPPPPPPLTRASRRR